MPLGQHLCLEGSEAGLRGQEAARGHSDGGRRKLLEPRLVLSAPGLCPHGGKALLVSSPIGPTRGQPRGVAGRCVRTAVPQVTHIQVGWEEKTPGSRPVQGPEDTLRAQEPL